MRELARALGDAVFMLMLRHFDLRFERVGLTLHQCLFLRKLLPFVLGVFEFQACVERIRRGFDCAARVDAPNHVVLLHGLPFGDIDIGEFAIDRRIDAAHFGFGRKRAVGCHDHVCPADERPRERDDDQRRHRGDGRLDDSPRLFRENRDALGTVLLERLVQRLEATRLARGAHRPLLGADALSARSFGIRA